MLDADEDGIIALAPAGSHLRRAIQTAQRNATPFTHWILPHVLPLDLCDALTTLPFDAPRIDDTLGKRETNNATRLFVSPANRQRFPACAVLADAFQEEPTIAALHDVCRVRLDGSYLRIEYCLDTDGFWLEPHTDIGAKLFTMLVYLSDHPDAADWGTDIMDAAGHVLRRAPGSFNGGLIFVPANDTWHGFERRPINGLRRSLIINYVRPEWRSRHELAFPDAPIGA